MEKKIKKKKMPRWQQLVWLGLIGAGFAGMGCGNNMFKDFSAQDEDAAYYEDALKASDKGDYDLAITKFEKVTGTLASNRKFLGDKAAAYAGRCGLNFINNLNNLSSFNPGTSTLFKELMKSVQTVTVKPNDCATSEAIMMGIGDRASLRNSDENLFMLLLSMFKMGAYLKAFLDPTGAGQATAGIDVCTIGASTSTGSSAMPSYAMIQMASGFSHFLDTFSSFSGFPTAVQTAVQTISGMVCSFLYKANVAGNPCTVYDAANIGNNMTTTEFEGAVNTVRDMLKTGPSSTVMKLGVQEAADTPCDPPAVLDPGMDAGVSSTTFRACCTYMAGSP